MTRRRGSVLEPWEATGEELKCRWRAAKEPELSEFEKEQLIDGKHITRTGGASGWQVAIREIPEFNNGVPLW